MSTHNESHIRLGQYILGETLGTGAFAKVKIAEHAVTGHKVALKIISRRKILDMEMVGRIKREIQYLKVLRHPHIIKLYEVLTTPTEIVMVMEYAGNELFNLIVKQGKLNENEARKLFQQIISAVEFCHRHKIVHRDLKPENVLLDDQGNVKIADFGLSNIMRDGNFLKTSCGSPNYAAPEVISGKLYAGPEVDVWSCGVILYVMICGRLPFDEEYIPALFKKINEGKFTFPAHLSDQVKELISAMLIVDPVKRITIAEIRKNNWFIQDLPAYLEPLPSLDVDALNSVDEEIVNDLQKRLRLDRKSIEDALKQDTMEGKNIKVAYQLIADQKKNLISGSRMHAASSQNFYLSASVGGREDDSISILSSSLSQSLSTSLNSPLLPPSNQNSPQLKHLELPIAKAGTGVSPGTSTLTARITTEPTPNTHIQKKQKARWHLGIRSKALPKEILLEIYNSLKKIGVEWKPGIPILDQAALPEGHGGTLGRFSPNSPSASSEVYPYRIPCRVTQNNVCIYFEWTLFKTGEGNYLVDFKHTGWKILTRKEKLSPTLQSCILFMDTCAELIIHLTVNS